MHQCDAPLSRASSFAVFKKADAKLVTNAHLSPVSYQINAPFLTPPTNLCLSFPRRRAHPRPRPVPCPNSAAIVSVDGKEIWRRFFSGRDFSSRSCGGVETHFVDLDLSLLSHTDDEATVTVTTSLDQVRIADQQWRSVQGLFVKWHAPFSPSPTTSLASFPPLQPLRSPHFSPR